MSLQSTNSCESFRCCNETQRDNNKGCCYCFRTQYCFSGNFDLLLQCLLSNYFVCTSFKFNLRVYCYQLYEYLLYYQYLGLHWSCWNYAWGWRCFEQSDWVLWSKVSSAPAETYPETFRSDPLQHWQVFLILFLCFTVYLCVHFSLAKVRAFRVPLRLDMLLFKFQMVIYFDLPVLQLLDTVPPWV